MLVRSTFLIPITIYKVKIIGITSFFATQEFFHNKFVKTFIRWLGVCHGQIRWANIYEFIHMPIHTCTIKPCIHKTNEQTESPAILSTSCSRCYDIYLVVTLRKVHFEVAKIILTTTDIS